MPGGISVDDLKKISDNVSDNLKGRFDGLDDNVDKVGSEILNYLNVCQKNRESIDANKENIYKNTGWISRVDGIQNGLINLIDTNEKRNVSDHDKFLKRDEKSHVCIQTDTFKTLFEKLDRANKSIYMGLGIAVCLSVLTSGGVLWMFFKMMAQIATK